MEKTKDGTEISMEDYTMIIEEINYIRNRDKDTELQILEDEILWKYVGKISYLA